MAKARRWPKGTPTAVKRLPETEAAMLEEIAGKLGLSFGETWRRLSGKNLHRLYRRMKAGERIELGEPVG